MSAIENKYLLGILRIWRDEACVSPAEGAMLACGLATAAMLAVSGLRSELPRIFGLVASFLR